MEAIVLSPVCRPFRSLLVAWNLLSRWRGTAWKACSHLPIPRRVGLPTLWVHEWSKPYFSSHQISNVLCAKCNWGSLLGVCWLPRLCLWPFKVSFQSCRSICHPHCACHLNCKRWRWDCPRWPLKKDSSWHRLHIEAYVARWRVDPWRFRGRQGWW